MHFQGLGSEGYRAVEPIWPFVEKIRIPLSFLLVKTPFTKLDVIGVFYGFTHTVTGLVCNAVSNIISRTSG